jgi:hypothetical protein
MAFLIFCADAHQIKAGGHVLQVYTGPRAPAFTRTDHLAGVIDEGSEKCPYHSANNLNRKILINRVCCKQAMLLYCPT